MSEQAFQGEKTTQTESGKAFREWFCRDMDEHQKKNASQLMQYYNQWDAFEAGWNARGKHDHD